MSKKYDAEWMYPKHDGEYSKRRQRFVMRSIADDRITSVGSIASNIANLARSEADGGATRWSNGLGFMERQRLFGEAVRALVAIQSSYEDERDA